MPSNTRRAAISVMGSLVVAGCLGAGSSSSQDNSNDAGGFEESTPTQAPDADGDGVPDSEDDFPDDPSHSEEVWKLQDVRQIQEDEYYRWQVRFPSQTTFAYQFTVREGPEIDVLTFSSEEFQHYQDEKRARYKSAASVTGSTAGQAQTTLSSGTYYFVLDNTDWGEAVPPTNFDDDVAEVEIKALAAQ